MLRPASFGLNQIGSRVLTASRSLKVHSPSEVLRICRAQACTMAAARLHSNEDMYGGVIVEPSSLPTDPQEFRAALQVALEEWHAAGKRGIWLKVPVGKASLIAPAIEGSFKFHHAEEGYVMLTRWLPEEPSTLPPNASHQVGIGACVINEQGQVLVVQERNGPLKGKQVWKVPTGLVHAGEDLCDAAEREVWEETGVQCKFEGMLAVRQAHGFAFGKSDLFFVCALRPQAGQNNLQPQEAEIVAVQWMDWQEYCQQVFLQQPLHAQIAECCAAYARGEYKGFAAARLQSSVVRPREDLLMWGQGRGQHGAQPGGQQQQQAAL